ncbi:MAG: type IX secretion system membrane protein PorP/SprF [Bacteroidota bacterium]
MKNITVAKATLFILLIIIFSSNKKLYAQYDAMFTQYNDNEMFINPAYTGSKDALCLTALHRQQWVGIQGRPITTSFTMHSPVLENKMGLGLSFLTEKLGVTSRSLIYLSYSYILQTGYKNFLGFGLMGGAHIQYNGFKDVLTDEPYDPRFSANVYDRTTLNFGFGMNFYSPDKYFFGISIPRLVNDNQVIGNNGRVKTTYRIEAKSFTYYLTGGGLVTLSDNFKLQPTVMVKVAINAPLEFDVTPYLIFKDRLWGGVSLRTNNSLLGDLNAISALFKIKINQNFTLGYAYDYTYSSLNKFQAGSHEIVLSLLFGKKGKKIASIRYF